MYTALLRTYFSTKMLTSYYRNNDDNLVINVMIKNLSKIYGYPSTIRFYTETVIVYL